jgi:hypothetical protein
VNSYYIISINITNSSYYLIQHRAFFWFCVKKCRVNFKLAQPSILAKKTKKLLYFLKLYRLLKASLAPD